MKTYKRKGYDIEITLIQNSILPPKGYSAINLGLVFTRDALKVSDETIRHEVIHTLQTRELLYIPYYLLYVLEYIVKLLFYIFKSIGSPPLGGFRGLHKKAYYSISFEQEANKNSKNLNYQRERKRFAFARYIFKII